MKNLIVTQRPRWHHGGEINYRKAGAGGERVKEGFLFIFYDVFPSFREDPAFDMWVEAQESLAGPISTSGDESYPLRMELTCSLLAAHVNRCLHKILFTYEFY